MKLLNLLLVLSALTNLAAEARQPTPTPYLWRIDGAKPSYLFGTIHLANPDVTKLASVTTRAVDSVDALYCELPFDMASQMQMAGALLGAGKPLSEVLPKDLYGRAEAELKRINPVLDLKPFDRMQVWALAMTISVLEEQLKYMGAQPVDAILYNRAAAAGKEVGGIETIAEQMGLFDQFSAEEQNAMLRGTLDDMERARREGRSSLAELHAAYLSGEMERVEKTITDWMSTIEPGLRNKLVESLFTKRNKLMAERIAAKLKGAPAKSFFFAIGAGHLYGTTGVVALLEKAGYKVTRVTD